MDAEFCPVCLECLLGLCYRHWCEQHGYRTDDITDDENWRMTFPGYTPPPPAGIEIDPTDL